MKIVALNGLLGYGYARIALEKHCSKIRMSSASMPVRPIPGHIISAAGHPLPTARQSSGIWRLHCRKQSDGKSR